MTPELIAALDWARDTINKLVRRDRRGEAQNLALLAALAAKAPETGESVRPASACPFAEFRRAWAGELARIFGDRWPILAEPGYGEPPELYPAAAALRERVRVKLGDKQALIVAAQAADAIALLGRARLAIADDAARVDAEAHVRGAA